MFKLIIIILLILIEITIVGSTEPTQKWVYKVVKYHSIENNERTGSGAFKYNTIDIPQEELNALGSEGWELVTSYLEMETAYPNFGNEEYVTGIQPNVRPQCVVLIFRRPIK